MQNLNKRNVATGNVKEIIIYTENIFLLLENGFWSYQIFFCKGLSSALPAFSLSFYVLKRKGFGICQPLLSLLTKPLSSQVVDISPGLISQTSGFNQVHGVPGWRGLGDSCLKKLLLIKGQSQT